LLAYVKGVGGYRTAHDAKINRGVTPL
jgi:hypothetical protein